MGRRPNFNQAVRRLIRDLGARMPEFAHIKAGRVLVVAGEARRASRGTVKPLAFTGSKAVGPHGERKAVVRVNGKRMLYCITLRPLFFRASTPQARIATLLHELFHISPRFDGTLAPSRRHARSREEFPKMLRPLVRRYLRICSPEVWAPFAFDGEVRVLMWLERPGSFFLLAKRGVRRVYTEDQLYWGIARMITTRARPVRAPRSRIALH